MRIGIVLSAVPAYSETFFSSKIRGLESEGHTVILFVDTANNQTNTTISTIKAAPTLVGNFVFVGFLGAFKLLHAFLFHFKRCIHLYSLDKKDGASFLQIIKNIVRNHHIISESVDWLHFGFGTLALNRENIAKAIGAKMAVSFRGFDIGMYPIKNPNCYAKLWNKVDKIHVISDDIKQLLYQHGFKEQSEVVKITPAINTAVFNKEYEQSIPNNNKFVSVARLHWKKGLVYTLEALSLLQKEGIPFHYTIIGSGKEYERLKFAAHQLEIMSQVTFAGELAHDLISSKLMESSIYLQYSIQEGFCNAVLEAQATGLLCIVSDAEGLPENVLDNKSGWVVEKNCPEKLAEKIKKVLNLPLEEKNKIRKFAIHRIRNEFNLEKQQQEFIKFYTN
ncbi:MAG: glycosyltransferase family 4 protein [Flavobacteriaceae bacterium]|nr:glycosyltransferase family 4 protein [Flavobacteriaceae bacterium]